MRNPATKRPPTTEPRIGICGNTVSIHDKNSGRAVFMSLDEYVRAEIEGVEISALRGANHALRC